MMNKSYKECKENRGRMHIEELYHKMLATNGDRNERKEIVRELLQIQHEDGSWRVTDYDHVDSDFLVHYVYEPTYYATAAIMFADNKENYSDGTEERMALVKGLSIAKQRRLCGHGFDATASKLRAMNIYKGAGLYEWMNRQKDDESGFCEVIHDSIAGFKCAVEEGRTFSDWNVDFRDAFNKEIADYDRVMNHYVWYACYGSNLNKERFMRYIERCTDTESPVEDRPYSFKYSIYFAKAAANWQGGGKAFLDDTTEGFAYGRIYKVTSSQFEQIKGFEGNDYRKKILLGEIDGIPVYSFTDMQKNKKVTLPSVEYFKVVLAGLKECYCGLVDEKDLTRYLVDAIMPEGIFETVKAIQENEHYLSNFEISRRTGMPIEEVSGAVAWLVEHKVVKHDRRSLRAGHSIESPEAFFYTVDSPCARELVAEMRASLCLEEESIEECEEDEIVEGNVEGTRRYINASRIERSARNRRIAIQLHGYKCRVCGFDYAEVYGNLGRNYIEVHHIEPLGMRESEGVVNPETDLVCLCANCHRMIHRDRNKVMSVNELKVVFETEHARR